jgi:hypothetical protein
MHHEIDLALYAHAIARTDRSIILIR